jgi:hypothetical protein
VIDATGVPRAHRAAALGEGGGANADSRAASLLTSSSRRERQPAFMLNALADAYAKQSRSEVRRGEPAGREARPVPHLWMALVSVATGAVRLVVLAFALGVVRAELRRVVFRSESLARAQHKGTDGDERHDHLPQHFLPPLLDSAEREAWHGSAPERQLRQS